MSPLEAITKLYELKRMTQENKDSPPEVKIQKPKS